MTSADPCTGARKAGHRSGADSPRGIDHGQFDGARVPPRWSGPQGAIGRSRRIGSVLEGYAALGRRPRVTLRFATLHFARPAAGIQEPHERGKQLLFLAAVYALRRAARCDQHRIQMARIADMPHLVCNGDPVTQIDAAIDQPPRPPTEPTTGRCPPRTRMGKPGPAPGAPARAAGWG